MPSVSKPRNFPKYGDCPARPYIDNLVRLLAPNLFATQYIDARSAAALVAAGLQSYQKCRADARWQSNAILREVPARERMGLVCAALFDLVCNAEYVHGRLVNRSWIYCNRHRDDARGKGIHSYYSFLKQCPQCCLDRGLDPRLSGAQHKPTSHHIGEITVAATALFVKLLGESSSRALDVGVISKQSHDVDLLAWRNDLLVLFEVKSSPLVTYPIRTQLAGPFTEPGDNGPIELAQHRLIDVDFRTQELSMYLANRNVDIPLGKPDKPTWPYPQLSAYVGTVDGFLQYIEAWVEIFLAYRVPKTERKGRHAVLGYLANGWGDEIDSNKTKAGLGRTDDIKKGTYQLLKFGAYYRDGSPNLPIRGVLTANLDPLFMYMDYFGKLIDARWAPERKFKKSQDKPEYQEILERDLFYIYDAVLAFNRPVINDKALKGCFKFSALEKALVNGKLATTLKEWRST